MKCPKCGYLPKAQDRLVVPENECPSCGVIFGKIKNTENQRIRGSQPPELLNNPSPVSAASLQKARERVERRLRQQQKAQHSDSRHIQTLKLARRLSAEGVRKRQAEWEKHKREEAPSPAQEETNMNLQHNQGSSSSIAPEDQESNAKLKQSSSTIAMALQKKKSEPMGHSSVLTTKNHATDTPSKDVPSVGSAEVSLPPNKPIRLFQNQPIGVEEKSPKPPTLKEMLKDFDPPEPNPPAIDKPTRRPNKGFRGGLIGLLPMVAWLILGAGVIGAILSWTTLANAQPGTHTVMSSGGSTLPFGLLIGFAYLATGVLGFAFFWVSSLISHQLKDIQRLLLLQSRTRVEPEVE